MRNYVSQVLQHYIITFALLWDSKQSSLLPEVTSGWMVYLLLLEEEHQLQRYANRAVAHGIMAGCPSDWPGDRAGSNFEISAMFFITRKGLRVVEPYGWENLSRSASWRERGRVGKHAAWLAVFLPHSFLTPVPRGWYSASKNAQGCIEVDLYLSLKWWSLPVPAH